MTTTPYKLRKIWRNYVRDQTANPIRLFRPETFADLTGILRQAREKGLKVKPVGSGHSSSDIALTRDYMIDTHGLCREFDLKQLDLNPENTGNNNLFFAEAGMTIHNLNKTLDSKGKALINMGAYDGQTIAGVVSTSTHGSGVTLGAFPDSLKAIFLLTEDGTLLQIEPSGNASISKGPANIPHANVDLLIRDDDYFYAAGVSMGCMGIIYAVVLEITDKYMLEETRTFTHWSEVRPHLASGILLKEYRHVEVLVSPYRYKGRDHKCMVTKRKIAINKAYKSPVIPRGHRKILPELLVRLVPAFILDNILLFIVNHFPKAMPAFVQSELSTLTDKDYVDKSYKVLNLGADNNLAAYASEISLPASTYLDAVDEIIRVVNDSAKEGEQYLNAPFSLRFVKTNRFFLSMQYNRRNEDFVCMIEFPTVSGTIGGMELLARIETALYPFGGIPHWGQVNHIGGNGRSAIAQLYPRFADWMQIYGKLCPKNRFANDFTNACGISNTF
jgi:L-gulono-1,4-lactone dehydrogenase